MYVRYEELLLSLFQFLWKGYINPICPLTAFEDILSVIVSDSFQEIEGHWSSMRLEDCIKPKAPLDRDISGLYALKHPRYGIIYIGKGNPIFLRVRSHYKATQLKETAPVWKAFFEYINSNITIYWREDDYKLDPFIGEQRRQALERLLQIKYKPHFDILYSRVRRKEIRDIAPLVEAYFSELHT